MSWKITSGKEAGEVLIGGRVLVSRSAHLSMTPGLTDGSRVDLDIVFDVELMKVVCDSISVTRPSVGAEVTTRYLREIKVHNAVIKVAMNHMIRVLDQNNMSVDAAKALDHFLPAKGRGRAQVVSDAAIIYTIARLADMPPLKTVGDQINVSQSTATRLVSEARRNDLLDSLESLDPVVMSPEETDAYFQLPRQPSSDE